MAVPFVKSTPITHALDKTWRLQFALGMWQTVKNISTSRIAPSARMDTLLQAAGASHAIKNVRCARIPLKTAISASLSLAHFAKKTLAFTQTRLAVCVIVSAATPSKRRMKNVMTATSLATTDVAASVAWRSSTNAETGDVQIKFCRMQTEIGLILPLRM